jgi:hypothetical protein
LPLQTCQSGFANNLDDTFQIFQNLVIGEVKYSVVLRCEPFIALLIIPPPALEIVAHTIDFGNESCCVTDEIGNELAHRDLPSKRQSVDVMRL